MYNYALKPRRVGDFKHKRVFFRKQKKQCVKHMVNEYFTSSVSWQKRVIQLFIIFIAIYFIYFFIFSSYFKIKDVVAVGNVDISSDEINQVAKDYLSRKTLLIFSNDNYFLFSPKKLENKFSEKYFLEYMKIKRTKISEITITIKEKPAVIKYKVGDKEFLIDREGVTLSEAQGKTVPEDVIQLIEIPKKVLVNQNEIDEQNKTIVSDPQYQQSSSTVFVKVEESGTTTIKEVPKVAEVYEDKFDNVPEISKSSFDKDLLGRLIYLKESYNKKFSQLKVISYEYEKSKSNLITAITENNFKIFFKLDSDIDTQLTNLYKFIVEEKNYDTKGIEYIDLRYDNQVIVK